MTVRLASRRRCRADEGFTLIEILITIVLMGTVVVTVLAAVQANLVASARSRSAARVESAIVNVADRINSHWYRHPLWAGLTVGSLLLLIAPWLVGPGVGDLTEVEPILKGMVPLAAAGLVVVVLGWKPLRALFESRPVQFSGTISFSLYLVHVPILIFSTYLFADQPFPPA